MLHSTVPLVGPTEGAIGTSPQPHPPISGPGHMGSHGINRYTPLLSGIYAVRQGKVVVRKKVLQPCRSLRCYAKYLSGHALPFYFPQCHVPPCLPFHHILNHTSPHLTPARLIPHHIPCLLYALPSRNAVVSSVRYYYHTVSPSGIKVQRLPDSVSVADIKVHTIA